LLREYNKLIVRLHRLLDIGLTVAAFISAYFIKRYLPAPFGGLSIDPDYYIILMMIIIIWYSTFSLCGLYESYRKKTFSQIFREMTKAIAIGMGILVLIMYLLKITDVSRILLGIFLLLDILLLGINKGLVYKVLAYYRSRQFNFRNILIIGSKERAKDTINAIHAHAYSGYKILGCLETELSSVGREVKSGIAVIGLLKDLNDFLSNNVVDELIVAMPFSKIDDPSKYIVTAETLGIPVRIFPDWQIHNLMHNSKIARISYEDFFGYPTITISTTPPRKDKLLIKYAFDYILSAFVFIVLLPLFVLIAIAIKTLSTGPVLYTQERCGLNGRKFMLYKFRTMQADAEKRQQELEAENESDGPVFKIRNDPRIIPYIGNFLRKTSLDELPQLINVLRGEMSLVGPRPPIPAEVEKYDDWQRRRLSMKPGLTCIWQITPNRNDISFSEWMRMDLEYIDNWSLLLDFKLMLKTAKVVLLGQGR